MIASAGMQIGQGLRSVRAMSVVLVAVAAVLGYVTWRRRQEDPSEEQLELERRAFLAEFGRITDGNILETQGAEIGGRSGESTAAAVPHTLIYQYRIAGVTYECAQDVRRLETAVRDIRIDLPIQVRFDPRNPADSIVVAEGWSGLRHAAPLEPRSEPSEGGTTPFREAR